MSGKHRAPGYKEFICGWFAAFAETFVTFPLNKIIFRQQLHGVSASVATSQLTTEGYRYLYRGCLPPLLQKTCARALMFGCFERYKSMLGVTGQNGASTSHIFTGRHAVAAFLAGSTEALLCPFERMQTILQSTAYHGRYRDTVHLAMSLRKEFGYREYYRGMSAIVWRNGCSNTIFFACREPLRRRFASDDSASKFRRFGAAFISGAILGGLLSTLFYPLNVSGGLLSTLFYPLNVVKTRMQSQLGGTYQPMHLAFQEIYTERHRSISMFYRGVRLNFLRAILTWGLTNLIYDVALHMMGDDDRHPLLDSDDLLTKIEYNEERNPWTWVLE